MYYIVYKITNKINNKYYIGVHKTRNLKDSYMGSGVLIKLSIKKYGVKNFKKEILFTFDNEKDMFLKEIELISILKPQYNLHEGGRGGWKVVNNAKKNGLIPKRLGGRKKGSKNKIKKGKIITHGIISSYTNKKCRCTKCKRSWAEYQRPKVKHYRILKSSQT